MTTGTDELKRLIEARGRATAGEWKYVWHTTNQGGSGDFSINAPDGRAICWEGMHAEDGDPNFIASAANWVSDHAPALLARLERYEAALDVIRMVTGSALHEVPSNPEEYLREIVKGTHEKARAALNDGQEKA